MTSIEQSQEYIECYEKVNNFSLMMKLLGYHTWFKDKLSDSALSRILEQDSEHLDFRGRFKIGTKTTSYSKNGRTSTILQCEVTFYSFKDVEKFKVRFRLYNDILNIIKRKYPVDFKSIKNGQEISCFTLKEVDRLIKQITSCIW